MLVGVTISLTYAQPPKAELAKPGFLTLQTMGGDPVMMGTNKKVDATPDTGGGTTGTLDGSKKRDVAPGTASPPGSLPLKSFASGGENTTIGGPGSKKLDITWPV